MGFSSQRVLKIRWQTEDKTSVEDLGGRRSWKDLK